MIKNIHIGIIPDGNRRYAKKNNISMQDGYLHGFKLLKKILETFFFMDVSIFGYNVNQLTIYVCSKDNLLKRTTEEVDIIYKMIKKFIIYCEKNIDKINKYQLGINIAGQIDLLNDNLKLKLENISNITTNNKKYILNLAIGYDCKFEIIRAYKLLQLNNENIDENNINKYFYIKDNIDIVIRTGNETRMSGFFPLQTIYAEWFFLKKYWGELKMKNIYKIIYKYEKIDRRYGK